LEGEKDTLAAAVLRELSEPAEATVPSPTQGEAAAAEAKPASAAAEEKPTPATKESIDAGDMPEFEESTGEAALSDDELAKLAQSSGLPLEGVELDARGLPRKRVSVPEPPVDGDNVARDSAYKVTTLSESIIIDAAAVGAPVEVREDAAKTRAARAGDTSPHRVVRAERERTAPAGLVIAVVALGLLSYLGMRYVLRVTEPTNAAASAEAASAAGTVEHPGTVTPSPAPAPSVANEPTADSTATDAADDVAVADVGATEVGATAAPPAPVYEDPAPFLDGGRLAPGLGLVVIDGPGEISVNRRAVGPGPTLVQLPAGTHTVTYRRGDVTGFRVVTVEPGRAVRVVLPSE
jgi:hypothetical protein